MSSNKRIAGLVDIGCNLLDPMFKGEYRGVQKHISDLTLVLQRSNLSHIIVTAGTLSEAKHALEFIQQINCDIPRLFSTVGVHPTRAGEFEDNPKEYLEELCQVARRGVEQGIIVAVGECGLDFNQDRIKFCSPEIQLRHFEKHFVISEELNLPLFLHSRESTPEMIEILKRNRHRFPKAVIHSFTGNMDEVEMILENLDEHIYIGINGCSLKTEENLQVLERIPMSRIVIETDAPWCDIRSTHAGFKYVKTHWECSKKVEKHVPSLEQTVKNRNEPCHLIQVLEIVSAVKNVPIDQAAEEIYQNTIALFPGILCQRKI
jgi:TatD DNase family protein